MRPFNVQREYDALGHVGKISVVPMDVSDLSAGESIGSGRKPSSSGGKADHCRRRVPRKERNSAAGNERISRKDRNKKRQSRRCHQRQDEDSSSDDDDAMRVPRLRRAQTVDTPINIRRERSPNSAAAPTPPLRRASTGPVEPRSFKRSSTGPTQYAQTYQPYGPLAPLAPTVPQRQASLRSMSNIPEQMDDTSETVATTDHDDSGYEQQQQQQQHCQQQSYAYVYQPDKQTYEPVQIRPVMAVGQPAKQQQQPPQVHIHAHGDVHIHRPVVPIGGSATGTTVHQQDNLKKPTPSPSPRYGRNDPRRYNQNNKATTRRNKRSSDPSPLRTLDHGGKSDHHPHYRRTASLDYNRHDNIINNDNHNMAHNQLSPHHHRHSDPTPAFRRSGTMDSLPLKPRRRDSAVEGASGSLQRTRSQSLNEKRRWY